VNPFATNAQFLDRHDGRWVAKNMLDDGTAPTVAQLADTGSAAGARLEALITDASEKLMAAASVGARYTVDDLVTYGGNLVISITCDLAIGPILKRRGRAVENYEKYSAAYTEACDYIEQLRRGERIFFAVPNVPEAGLPASADMAPNLLNPPNIASQAGRYFGCPAASDGYQNPSSNNGGGCGCGGWA